MKTENNDTMTQPHEDVWVLLRKRFNENEYALLQEVRDKAGFYASRSADGVAINLWPSRGLEIEGIEIKGYRSDWLNEKKNPEKAEAIFQYCDRWWIVAEHPGIIKEDEIPKTWGAMEVNGKKLKVIKQAPELKPKPITRHFLASLMKRATKGMVARSEVENEVERKIKDRMEQETRNLKYNLQEASINHADLKKKVHEFEQKSGIEIDTWRDMGKIGNAVWMITNDQGGVQRDMENCMATMTRAIELYKQALEEIKGLKKEQQG